MVTVVCILKFRGRMAEYPYANIKLGVLNTIDEDIINILRLMIL
jgi:hypothetical protein